jgi:hypothetical protein
MVVKKRRDVDKKFLQRQCLCFHGGKLDNQARNALTGCEEGSCGY